MIAVRSSLRRLVALALLAGSVTALRAQPSAQAQAQAQPPPAASASPAPVAAPPARPAPRPAAAPAALAALIVDDKDVRQSTLVGPSGQIYEPAAAAAPAAPASSAARWVRRLAGGVSSTVAGAARLDGELLVSGAQTPMFRHRDGQWLLAQLGQRGRVVYSSGPFFALAIGKQIFVAGKAPPAPKGAIPSVETPPTLRLLRVGAAPGNVIALWAASETAMYLLTDQGVLRRRGNAFLPALKLPGVVGFSGSAPHALTADTAINLRTGAKVRLTGPLLRVARSDSTPAALLRSPTGAIVLARDVTNAARNVELPPPPAAQVAPPAATTTPMTTPTTTTPATTTTAPATTTTAPGPSGAAAPLPPLNALVAVDAAGRALISSPTALLVYDGAAWSAGLLADELPAPRPGPAPARSR